MHRTVKRELDSVYGTYAAHGLSMTRCVVKSKTLCTAQHCTRRKSKRHFQHIRKNNSPHAKAL